MEEILGLFKNSLSDIMIGRDINIVQLGKGINADPSTLHKWFDSVRDIKLKTLIKLADYFKCSVEYLCGKTHDYIELDIKYCPKFCIRIREIINEFNLIPYKFLTQADITPSKYYYWLSGGEPMLTSLEKISRSLDITLDETIGLKY